jgi:alpha-amylase
LKLLLKNFQLSDDIAFRFSQQSWAGWPLTSEKFVDWINMIDQKQEVINLFMDYETFGEHQWQETGIFDFMRALPARVFSHSNFTFNTPSEVSAALQPVAAIFVPNPISWADEERDLTAWLGNDLQDEAFETIYAMEHKVNAINDFQLMKEWRYLQTSDHFYYMCTKWFSDGDVHKYFNPYGTPYEAFINYMNVLSDFNIRLDHSYDNIPLKDIQKEDIIAREISKPLKKRAIAKKESVSKTKDLKPKTSGLNAITSLKKTEILKVIKNVNLETLAKSLKGVKKDVRTAVINSLSSTMQKEMIAFDLTELTKPEIDHARKVVLNEINKFIA